MIGGQCGPHDRGDGLMALAPVEAVPSRNDPRATPRAFVVPAHLEAHEPPEARGLARDQVRLMVSRRVDDEITHARFVDLPAIVTAGDLLVVNDSATLPAALPGTGDDGRKLRLHLSTHLPGDLWVLEPRTAEGGDGEFLRDGETLALPGGADADILAPYRESSRLWIARLTLPESLHPYLQRWGHPIRYAYVPREWPLEMYQTVFARVPGSAEMPSAGRPFSRRVLDALRIRGIAVAPLTLHAGVASLEAPERPVEEYYEIPAGTADAIIKTKARGGRVIAVGTTVVRALESAAADGSRLRPARGWTDLVITARGGVRVADGLLTGFHEPKSTHLGMLDAIAGSAHIDAAYREALDQGYLWHEFGDVHLIL